MVSLCILWPTSFDYPIFRKHLADLKKYVDEVVVCFNPHGSHALDSWVVGNVPDLIVAPFYDAIGGDWRHQGTTGLIEEAKGDWLLFFEPDFFIKDIEDFFKKVSTAMATSDVISFLEAERFHPAFLLVKRDKLEKTSMDFSATNGFDHFGRVSQELKRYNYVTLPELGLFQDVHWVHWGGITDNYFAPKPYHKLEEFRIYNKKSMEVQPMSDYWMGEMKRCEEMLKNI